MKETQPKAEPVDAADVYRRYPSFTIDFRAGVVASARFESPGKVWLLRGGAKFKLPLSRCHGNNGSFSWAPTIRAAASGPRCRFKPILTRSSIPGTAGMGLTWQGGP